MKLCTKCFCGKDYSHFGKDSRRKDGLTCWCKECQKKHRDKPKVKARAKIWRERWKVSGGYQEYLDRTRENRNVWNRAWLKTSKGKAMRKRRKERLMKDPKAKLSKSMSRGIGKSLNGKRGDKQWQELVGYSAKDLIIYWDTIYSGWRKYLDMRDLVTHHVIPVRCFNYISADDPEFKRCWAFYNLQPTSSHEHRKLHQKHWRENTIFKFPIGDKLIFVRHNDNERCVCWGEYG